MSQLQQDELRRKRVNETDHIDPSNIHAEDDRDESETNREEKDKETLEHRKKIKHPYLGSKIDLNG